MKKWIKAYVFVAVSGIGGILFVSSWMNRVVVGGAASIILAIAAVGTLILSAINDMHTK